MGMQVMVRGERGWLRRSRASVSAAHSGEGDARL